MSHYTKKPVTIEAMRWLGDTVDGAAPSWVVEALQKDPGQSGALFRERQNIHVFTTEGVMIAQPGDWIIRGVEGELYPCKDSVFQATYLPASREPDATGKPAITRAEADASLSAAPAPRVTLEAMEAKVASAEYFRSNTLTICILTLANGFTIVGKSACASPENYDRALGERYAYDDAFRQIWAFEGYLLRERLAAA